MKKTIVLLTAFIFSNQLFAQSPMSAFENIVGSKWEIKGKWENGQDFKQEYIYEWSLGKKMIKVKTYGTVNMDTKEYGLRNEGVRFLKEDGTISFYEFDVYGGVTQGSCSMEGKNIYYTYEYNGSTLRDSWIYQDENTYQLIIESLVEGVRKDLYQTSTIKRLP